MTDDEIALRIEAFDAANGGGVAWYNDKGAHHLYLLTTEAPTARLKPVGTTNEVRLGYWLHRRKWEDIDDMGGCVLPLDHIANNRPSGPGPNGKRTRSSEGSALSGDNLAGKLEDELLHPCLSHYAKSSPSWPLPRGDLIHWYDNANISPKLGISREKP